MTVELPLVVGYGRAMELIITGRPVDAEEALRIGLANEVVPEGKALERALELAHQIAALPRGAIRSDKETMVRNVGRTTRSSFGRKPRTRSRCSPERTRTRSVLAPSGRPHPGVAASRPLDRASDGARLHAMCRNIRQLHN